MARIAVTGSSGLIGTALVAALSDRGDEVVRLVRRPRGLADEVQWDPSSRPLDPSVLDGVDGLVNLASAGLGDRRWSRRRTSGRSSRPGSTRLTQRPPRSPQAKHPVRLVCASASGYYGDRGDEPLTEESGQDPRSSPTSSPPGRPRPRQRWHPARRSPSAAPASSWPRGRTDVAAADTRPVRARRAAGRWRQFWSGSPCPTRSARSCTCSTTRRSRVRSTSPRSSPSQQRDIARALGRRCTGRPSCRPPPSRCAWCSASSPARSSAGQRIVGDVLRDSGYSFVHPDLDSAIRWLVA